MIAGTGLALSDHNFIVSMYKEELLEEGIVRESKDGIAKVIIVDSNHCEECSAKIYCKPVSGNEKELIVQDKLGTKTGDIVLISVPGRKILLASIFLYGIPLLLLIGSILLGLNLFENNKELLSTISALLILTAYFILLKLFSGILPFNQATSITEIVHKS